MDLGSRILHRTPHLIRFFLQVFDATIQDAIAKHQLLLGVARNHGHSHHSEYPASYERQYGTQHVFLRYSVVTVKYNTNINSTITLCKNNA